jgi:hypothetical protein
VILRDKVDGSLWYLDVGGGKVLLAEHGLPYGGYLGGGSFFWSPDDRYIFIPMGDQGWLVDLHSVVP